MKTRTLLLLLSLLWLFAQPLVAAHTVDVSLIQLIASPKDYDGKIVRLIGFMRLEFEGNAIYLHQDDYNHGISKNGLWITVTEDMQKRKAEFDRKYVLIEGTFDAKEMGAWCGSVRKITRCQVWR